MRARLPDHQGHVEVDGVRIGYEVHGDGSPTIMLLPTWTIVHSRIWKSQVAYLARHHRVVTFDMPGNGRSDRPEDRAAYAASFVARATLDVMDRTETATAVLVSLSRGASWSLQLGAEQPDRVLGQVLIAPSVPLTPQAPERQKIPEEFLVEHDDPQGWQTYNRHHWLHHWEEFCEFFFAECFSEPHSTKQREDAVGWALETTPEVMVIDAFGSDPDPDSVRAWCRAARSPVLAIHGTHDRVSPLSRSEAVAREAGGELIVLAGSGHIPLARDPVVVNHILHEFAERVAPRQPAAPAAGPAAGPTTDHAPSPVRVWTRGLDRRLRVLYLSSPIGLGHIRRDLAIADALRTTHPQVEVDWLGQHPVTSALAAAGETVHPASRWLASESAHITDESDGHELHCFQALRRMDEILVANFHVAQEVVEEGLYDVVVGDEAWELDHHWHENPELKRGAHVWLTDFVGYLPMRDGHEAMLTADYNAEMIEHIARHPRVRDCAVFVGEEQDVVADPFGPGLPSIRDWTTEHFAYAGYITGFAPPSDDDRRAWRDEFGYRPGEPICIVSVGGSGVGSALLRRAIDALPLVRRQVPDLRMVAVTGPRIDPDSLPRAPGLDVRGFVPDLHRHLSVCDVALVQGGLTTTMELTAAGTPFVYLPLVDHFEQQRHVRHRLERHRAGRCVDFTTTDIDALAAGIVDEIGREVDYRPVPSDGAERAAAMIAELL